MGQEVSTGQEQWQCSAAGKSTVGPASPGLHSSKEYGTLYCFSTSCPGMRALKPICCFCCVAVLYVISGDWTSFV